LENAFKVPNWIIDSIKYSNKIAGDYIILDYQILLKELIVLKLIEIIKQTLLINKKHNKKRMQELEKFCSEKPAFLCIILIRSFLV